MFRVLPPVLWLAACSAAGPGNFSPPFEQTRMTLETVNPDGRIGVMDVTVSGTRDVGGVQVPVVSVRYPVGNQTAEVEIVGQTQGGQLTVGGFRVPHTDYGLGVDLVFASPLEVALDAPVGTTATVPLDGALTFGDPTYVDPGYLPFDVTTEILSHDAIAPSARGDVPGCRHATLSVSTTGLSGTAEIWTRDDTGLVHAVFDTVPWGRIETGPAQWTGFDDLGSTRVIQREGILDADHPSFRLSTYDIDGDFLADKDTHAQMWLEFRWADDDRARTTEQPPVYESFGTTFGTFPSLVVRSDVSVLHPEDATAGYVYWGAFVDQAAKNEAIQGISYEVAATHSGGDAVSVGAFIRYHRLTP